MRYFGDCVPRRTGRDRGPDPVPDPTDACRRARRPCERGARAMTGAILDAPADVVVPESHLDLLTRPVVGVLTTLLPDGQPHSSLVWVDYDGMCARVNTTLERRKGRDLIDDRRVSLLVVDPDDTSRFVQIRGEAELLTEGAEEHLDALTRRYTGHPSVLRVHLPGGPTWSGDKDHLPDPRTTGDPGRDPPVRSLASPGRGAGEAPANRADRTMSDDPNRRGRPGSRRR